MRSREIQTRVIPIGFSASETIGRACSACEAASCRQRLAARSNRVFAFNDLTYINTILAPYAVKNLITFSDFSSDCAKRKGQVSSRLVLEVSAVKRIQSIPVHSTLSRKSNESRCTC